MRHVLIAMFLAFGMVIGVAAGLSAARPASITPVIPACDLIINGGFEGGPGSGPWVTSTLEFTPVEFIGSVITRTGRYSARLAGYYLEAEDKLSQTVTIPVTAPSAILSYAWYMTTEEPFSGARDFLTTAVRSSDGITVLRVLTSVNNEFDEGVWSEASFDVSAYAGQTIQVHFLATNDLYIPDLPTAFFIDDVSLTICHRAFLPLVTRNP